MVQIHTPTPGDGDGDALRGRGVEERAGVPGADISAERGWRYKAIFGEDFRKPACGLVTSAEWFGSVKLGEDAPRVRYDLHLSVLWRQSIFLVLCYRHSKRGGWLGMRNRFVDGGACFCCGGRLAIAQE